MLAASLNVRAEPTLDGAVRATVARGDTLCVVSVQGDWARVRVPGPPEGAAVVQGFAARGFLSEKRVTVDQLRHAGCEGSTPVGVRGNQTPAPGETSEWTNTIPGDDRR